MMNVKNVLEKVMPKGQSDSSAKVAVVLCFLYFIFSFCLVSVSVQERLFVTFKTKLLRNAKIKLV